MGILAKIKPKEKEQKQADSPQPAEQPVPRPRKPLPRLGRVVKSVLLEQYQYDDNESVLFVQVRTPYQQRTFTLQGLELLDEEILQVPGRLFKLGQGDLEMQARLIEHFQRAAALGCFPPEFARALKVGFDLMNMQGADDDGESS